MGVVVGLGSLFRPVVRFPYPTAARIASDQDEIRFQLG
jgi:hypothetical protein